VRRELLVGHVARPGDPSDVHATLLPACAAACDGSGMARRAPAAEVARRQHPTRLWIDHAVVEEPDLDPMAPVELLLLWNVRLRAGALAEFTWSDLDVPRRDCEPVQERLSHPPAGARAAAGGLARA
jgi:hypothetical protein